MTNFKLIPFLSILFLTLASKASYQFEYCDSVQVIDAEMNYLVGTTLKGFALSESVYTKSILDPDEVRLANLPAQKIPKRNYLITDTKTCSLGDGKLYSIFVIQDQEGQTYQVPREKMEFYLKSVVRKEVKRLSFAYKNHSRKFSSASDAVADLKLQALSFCLQFEKMTKFKSLPDLTWERDEAAKGLNHEYFNPAYYGMSWTRMASTEFYCQ